MTRFFRPQNSLSEPLSYHISYQNLFSARKLRPKTQSAARLDDKVLASLRPTTEEVLRLPAFVCLSVCLLARLLKNAWIDLDEMLHVDRCQDMEELITFEPDPDHSPDAGTGLLSPISYAL